MRVAIVWGATGGIGRAIVKDLTAAGWSVIGVARDTEGLADMIGRERCVDADVRRTVSVKQAVMDIDYLLDGKFAELWIYAVGEISDGRVANTSEDEWQHIIDVNLSGAYRTLHHSLPILAKDAHIIFLGAKSEKLRLPRIAAYATAKAGLEVFVDVLAKELRSATVTLLRPGAVNTDFWRNAPFRLPKDALKPEEVSMKLIGVVESRQNGKVSVD